MKNKILFVFSLLFGLMFMNAGLNKFFQYMPMPKDMPENMMKVVEAFGAIVWLMPLIAVVEIIGGVLVIIPKYRALGAIMIFPIMIGILLTHIFNAPSGLPIALILFAVLAWIMIDNRAKYAAMFK
ncbi:DoxX family protein [Fluviicola taffensis]|uniref:DoxX family protein n=1 Tax=Fluviicola taffensis (strain DSM 16823 / NCIMB 13979 / RW262) TaxID=755732 RepID=F2IH12_FLUTR|nr:DoxX family protein [Fluviicola taffensis]AEA45826.1 DoxX family protein [Fluviicola taffensis DSM 16823]